MIPGARLIMLGRQGAGKGTQCVRLSRHFVVPHISTGDMLRAAVREGTELGRDGQEGDGRRRPRRRRDHDRHRRRAAQRTTTPHGRGYILDGFPRTVEPGEALDEITAERPIDVVLDLDVPRELVLGRISRPPGVPRLRHQLPAPGSRSPWICEVCGGDVMQRDDDTPEAIDHRLDLYEEQTAPADRVLPEPGPARRDRRRRHARRCLPRAIAAAVDGRSVRRLIAPVGGRAAARCAPPDASWPRCTEAIRAAAVPGVTTLQLDHIARDVLTARGADLELPRLPRLSGSDLRVGQRRDRARHPQRHGLLRRRRHRVDRLRRDRRRLARRRRVHDGYRHDRRPTPSG